MMDKGPRLTDISGTVAAAVFAADRLAGEWPAFVDGDGAAMSYRAALRVSETIADALAELGVEAADRVAFLSPRGPLGLLGFLAISSVAVCCPLNPRQSPGELAAAIAGLRISALVDIGPTPSVEAVANDLGLPTLSLAAVARVDDVAATWRRRRSAPRPAGEPQDCPPRLAMMMRTSGTTSQPKLVGLTHDNILSAARAIGGAFVLGPADLCLNPMPLHHVHGLISAGMSSLLAGSSILCTDGFSTAGFADVFARSRPTWFTASPAMHLALLEHFKTTGGHPPRDRLRFLRSSSAPLPASAIAPLEALFEAPLIETYGLTETSSMICSNPLPPLRRKLGSVGIAFGADIRIADAAGASCPAGERGEILIRGRSVIRAYVASDKPRSEAFFDDWLRTGDVGYQDEDGYLFIVGRTKELIKRGGLSVYPSEIDNILVSHPDVAEAVAFSLPHPTMGEELVAAVVARFGARPSEGELRAYIAARASAYKVPTAIIVTEEIPKNETGKIVRGDLAARLAGRLQPNRLPPATAFEAALYEAWKAVIGRDDFGVTDNVFVLGGDPLRAERVSGLLRSGHHHEVTARQLMANPSIREQAALISSGGAPSDVG